jgi:hypothetical protein
MSRTRRLIAVTSSMLAAAALAAGPAPADPHAQDAHERAVAAHQDLRSPDTRDAADGIGVGVVATSQDLRSPDTRDFAEGRRAPVVVRVDRAPDSGLSWDSAGIGALVTAGLLFALAGGIALVTRHRPRGVRAA